MKKLLLVSLLFFGRLASADNLASSDYHLFVYNNTPYNYGYFLDHKDGTWSEDTGEGAQFHFREVERDSVSVTMYDASRKLYARINQQQIYLRFDSEGEERFFKKGIWDNRRVLFGHQGNEGTQVIFALKQGRVWNVQWYNPDLGINVVEQFTEIKRDSGMVEIVNPSKSEDYIMLYGGKVMQRDSGYISEGGHWADPGPFN